jgi:hypothetical protein
LPKQDTIREDLLAEAKGIVDKNPAMFSPGSRPTPYKKSGDFGDEGFGDSVQNASFGGNGGGHGYGGGDGGGEGVSPYRQNNAGRRAKKRLDLGGGGGNPDHNPSANRKRETRACYGCNKKGHIQLNCPDDKRRAREEPEPRKVLRITAPVEEEEEEPAQKRKKKTKT